jgi:single-strand DNA-binding protein
MAFDNNVVLVGNITQDPELRYTNSGLAVCSLNIAWNSKNPRTEEEKAHFFEVSCWRQLAENVAESVTRGMRVVVYGRLDYQTWEGPNGEKRSAVKILADEVSPSVKWATAQVSKNERGGAPSQSSQPNPSNAGSDFGAGYEIPDEEPF